MHFTRAAWFGRLGYGRVEAHAGEFAETDFWYAALLPIFPRTSKWVVDGKQHFPIRRAYRSVAAAYLRCWAPLPSLGALASGYLPFVLAGAVLALLSVWSWTWLGVRSPRRSDFNLLAFSTRCEPGHWLPAMRERVQQALDTRWAALALPHSPEHVAEHAARTTEEAVVAYGLLRLVGDRRADAAAQRIVDGTYGLDAAHGGPFRELPARSDLGGKVEAEARSRTSYKPRPSLTAFSPIKAGVVVILATLFAALIVTGRSAFVPPVHVTGAELAAMTNPTDRLVEVECDRISDAGALDSTHALLECDVDDYALAVPIRTSSSGSIMPLGQTLVGQLSLDPERHLQLHRQSIVLTRFLVLTCAVIELALLALIGSWLSSSGRRRELQPRPAPRTS